VRPIVTRVQPGTSKGMTDLLLNPFRMLANFFYVAPDPKLRGMAAPGAAGWSWGSVRIEHHYSPPRVREPSSTFAE